MSEQVAQLMMRHEDEEQGVCHAHAGLVRMLNEILGAVNEIDKKLYRDNGVTSVQTSLRLLAETARTNQDAIKKHDGIFARLNWMVIAAVVGAILALVIR